MAVNEPPYPIQGSGEYGATKIQLTKNGDAYRLAFGREDASTPIMVTGAVILTEQAIRQLKLEMESFGL